MRVWVTRDEAENGPLCVALTHAGLDPVLEPVLQRTTITDAAEDLARLEPDDWLVLTSIYAVGAVAVGPARVPRVAVVGEKTHSAAIARGFRVELVSPDSTRDGLFRALRDRVDCGIVCYPRSSLAKAPKAWSGVTMRSPILYRTEQRDFDRSTIERVDMISVTSPSAVDIIDSTDRPFASVGPTTTRALQKKGIGPVVEASDRSFESLASAIADYDRASRHHRA